MGKRQPQAPATSGASPAAASKIPTAKDLREAVKQGLDDQRQREEAAKMLLEEVIGSILAALPTIMKDETSLKVYEVRWVVWRLDYPKSQPGPNPGPVPGPNTMGVYRSIYRSDTWQSVEGSDLYFPPPFEDCDSALQEFTLRLCAALEKLELKTDVRAFDIHGEGARVLSREYNAHRITASWSHIVDELKSAATEPAGAKLPES